MRTKTRSLWWLVTLIVLLFALSACKNGGGGDDDDGDGGEVIVNPISQQTDEQAGETLDRLFEVLVDALDALEVQNTAALQATAARTRQQEETVDVSFTCDAGGEASLKGMLLVTETVFDFEATLVLTECNDLSGSLIIDIEATVQEDIVDETITMDGTVMDNNCNLTFSAFMLTAVVNTTTEEIEGTVDGSVSGTCSNESFACDFNNTDIDDDLENSCRAF